MNKVGDEHRVSSGGPAREGGGVLRTRVCQMRAYLCTVKKKPPGWVQDRERGCLPPACAWLTPPIRPPCLLPAACYLGLSAHWAACYDCRSIPLPHSPHNPNTPPAHPSSLGRCPLPHPPRPTFLLYLANW